MIAETKELTEPFASNGDGLSLFHALPTLENGWPPHPFQIVSLLDMVLFCAGDFAETIRQLCLMMDEARWFSGHYGHDAFLDIECKDRLPAIRAKLDGLMTVVSRHKLKRSMEEIEKSQFIAPDLNSTVTVSVYQDRLWHIWTAIHSDLHENLFLFVPLEQAGYYEGFRQPAYIIRHCVEVAPADIELPFGQKVHRNFRGARGDINEAANCYATGRNTACVFHLTRILERGLFVLAQDQKLFALTANPSIAVSVADATLETWGTLIKKVEDAIDNIQDPRNPNPRGQKIRALQLYSGAAIHFRYFKDHWRNPISHSRTSYDEPQALSALGKVDEFMRHLAENIGLKEGPGMVLP